MLFIKVGGETVCLSALTNGEVRYITPGCHILFLWPSALICGKFAGTMTSKQRIECLECEIEILRSEVARLLFAVANLARTSTSESWLNKLHAAEVVYWVAMTDLQKENWRKTTPTEECMKALRSQIESAPTVTNQSSMLKIPLSSRVQMWRQFEEEASAAAAKLREWSKEPHGHEAES